MSPVRHNQKVDGRPHTVRNLFGRKQRCHFELYVRSVQEFRRSDRAIVNVKSKSARCRDSGDDFPEAAATLAKLLQESGNQVETAQDGIEAIETAAKFHPDIAVLDIAMPRLNGYDTARRIREQPWGKNMILVAFTGWGQSRDRHRSKEAGFDAHLTKPIRYEAFLELLANLSQERRTDR